ncbi:MAG TPA: LysM peptidoglycan-binding domain-containing protein, partial [Longimicrobiaceae bacterium]|nr:LysM peptidoglycan-binding domain-containing protein [Longimicrobiaceae bacterium]
KTLLSIEAAGAIDGTEEHHPPHFHVAVFPAAYRRYAASRGAPKSEGPRRAVAASTPARRTPAPAARTTSASARRTYQVRNGDSLWTIARRQGVSVAALREANGLGPRKALQPGQRLVIPAR